MPFARHQQSNNAFVGELRTKVDIARGGTSASSKQEAINNLGGISASLIGVPGGVLGLDETGKIPKVNDPRIYDTIDGPAVLLPGVSGTFEITNYDSRRTYAISTTDGTISRNNEFIVFTPSSTFSKDLATFIVNGRTLTVTTVVGAAQIVTPSIVSPVNNSLATSKFVTVLASGFKVLNNSLKFKASDWRVATDQTFSLSSVVFQQTLSTGDRSSLFLGPDVTTLDTELYVSVRYRATNVSTGAEITSNWSSAVKIVISNVSYGYKEVAQLFSNMPLSDSLYGSSVSAATSSIDDSVIIAASDVENNCVDIYNLSNVTNMLVLEKRITAPSPDTSFKYGSSVTLSPDGKFLAVSAPGYKTATLIKGAIYLYARGAAKNWQQSAILEGDNSSGFVTAQGKSIAVSNDGNRVVASEPGYDSNHGKVLVFVKNTTTWNPLSLTVPSSFASYALTYFGKDAIAVSSNSAKLAITCRTAVDTFTVLIFTANGSSWDYVGNLGNFKFTGNAAVSQCSLEFSHSGDKIVVGVRTATSVNNETGGRVSVWAFDSATGWTKESELYEHGLNIKSGNGTYFGSLYGHSVAFGSVNSSPKIFVGSPGYDNDDVNKNIGRVFAYSYVNGKWTYSGFYGPIGQANEDLFGLSLSCVKEGDCLVVGIPGDQTDVGSVSIYR